MQKIQCQLQNSHLNNKNNFLRWDFIITSDNYKFIEINGIQHYEPVEYFGGEERFKRRQEYDYLKEEFCKKNNYPYLIVKYDELHNLKYLIYDFLIFQ